MADKPSETKTFAQFLEEQPAPAETVTLTGYAARCAKPGSFSFTTGGQTMELPTDAVKSHKVLNEGPQRLVEIEVVASRIDPKILKPVASDGGYKNPIADHFTIKEVVSDWISDKHVHKDPIQDPITLQEGIDPGPLTTNPAAGMQPFVLATPHHAPAATIEAQMGTSSAALRTTPLSDYLTIVNFDRPHTYKEVAKDPIYDRYTLPETLIPDPDPNNSLAEGVGVQTGVGQVVNPAMQTQMLMAAPHQGPPQIFKNPITDVATISYYDGPHTVAWYDTQRTFKEVAKDPITDVYTLPETLPGGGGGTLQEGVGGGGVVTNPVWNLPGMMF